MSGIAKFLLVFLLLAGQLSSESKDGAQKTYGYDPRGQLTSVIAGSTPIESYSFDDSGNRTAEGGWYVGQSVDVERRILEHGARFAKAVYEPFAANVDKTTLRNLEEYLLRLAKKELGQGGENLINARDPKKYIDPCS